MNKKYIIAIIIILSAVIFVVPNDVFLMNLIQSFSHLAMVFYIMLALALLVWRKWLLSITSFSAGAILLMFLTIHLINDSDVQYEVNGTTFKVAQFNVLCSNTHYQKTIDQALNSEAALISFQEIDGLWNSKLTKGLEKAYPYHHFVNNHPHGLVIFSKYPLDDLITYHWAGVPTLTGNVNLNGTPVHFVSTHTLSPRTEDRFRKRNKHLKKIAQYLKTVKGPVLAIGDFNAVPWNPSIVQIKEQSDMIDSRKSITPTFPSSFKLAGIPIDYILHSNELTCLDFDAVDTMGSDHRGVVGEYVLEGVPSDLTVKAEETKTYTPKKGIAGVVRLYTDSILYNIDITSRTKTSVNS